MRTNKQYLVGLLTVVRPPTPWLGYLAQSSRPHFLPLISFGYPPFVPQGGKVAINGGNYSIGRAKQLRVLQ